MAKKFYGTDVRRNKVFGRFYRHGEAPLKLDLISLDDYEFKETKRGKVRRSKDEQDQLLARLYFEKEQELKTRTAKQDKGQKLQFVFSDWLNSVAKTRSPSTHQHYESSIEWFFKANSKALLSTELKSSHLDSMAALIVKSAKESTANSHLRSLKVACRWAFKQGLISQVPPFTMLREPKKDPTVFEVEELNLQQAVLFERKELKRRWELMLRAFMVFRWSGIRGSELLFLQWKDFDFEHGRILIRDRETFRVKGRREEDVPIASPLESFLMTVHRRGEVWFLDDGEGKRFWTKKEALSRAFARFHNELKLRGPKALHGYRATLATELTNKETVNLKDVQDLLRHVHISTTMGYVKSKKTGIKKMLDDLGKS